MMVCGINLSHNAMLKLGSVSQKIAIRWFLKVQFSLSADFLRWTWGWTSWEATSSSFMKLMMASDASLSKFCSLDLRPH